MLRGATSISRQAREFATPLALSPASPRCIRCHSSDGTDGNKDARPTSSSSETEPVWVRRERERKLLEESTKNELPWALYLLFSSFVAIAAVGCIFEYVDRNPFFGLVQPESPLWAPILISLAVTGFPTSALLFKKGVDGFNEDADRQNKIDGY